MEWNITAQVSGPDRLAQFWSQYFAETPLCVVCGTVASEVDPFFPYLDDLNRCPGHPGTITPPADGSPARDGSARRGRVEALQRLSFRRHRCRTPR